MTNPLFKLQAIVGRLKKSPSLAWKHAHSKRIETDYVVRIDAWGGTSVNPSQVFRTEKGRADLEAAASLAQKLKIVAPERTENA